jgi:hypothetical protein
MAKRNSGRKARTRKRSTGGSTATRAEAPETDLAAVKPRPKRTPARERRAAAPDPNAYRAPGSFGERPQPPWHPWPLSEILIFVGAIGTLVGFARKESGHAVLIAGLAAVMIGTLDFTIREHLSGYRSHTAMLASVPTAIFHGAAALGLFAAGAPRVTWVLVPVAIDVPLFWFLFRALRVRFQDARRERIFQAGRR